MLLKKIGNFDELWNFSVHELSVTKIPLKTAPESPVGYHPGRTFMRASVVHTAKNGTKTMYLFGGAEPPYIHALDLATLTWSIVKPKNKPRDSEEIPYVNMPRWGHSACIVPSWNPDKVVLFGGWDSSSQYSDIYVFDCTSKIVERVNTNSDKEWAAPSPRSGHSATATTPNTMMVFGGSWCDSGPYKFDGGIYTLDLSTMIWKDQRRTGENPAPRAQHAACFVWNRYLVIAGGLTEEFSDNSIYCFDTKYVLWHRVRAGNIIEPEHVTQTNFRVFPCQPRICMIDDDNLLIVGIGSGAGTYRLQMSSGTVSSVSLPNLPPLNCHVMERLHDRSVLVYGGLNKDTTKDSLDSYKIDIN